MPRKRVRRTLEPPSATLKERQICGCGGERHVPPKPARAWTRIEALAVARVLREKGTGVDRRIASEVLGSILEESRRGDCFTDVREMLDEARVRLSSGTDADGDASDAEFDEIRFLSLMQTRHAPSHRNW
ncbi:MAG TPA: hypothetical protein VG318_04310 [Actinomycetota bacterium]|nr:hypothetical protein [Actinomycetota bacterium]